jgi:hypothetical protein
VSREAITPPATRAECDHCGRVEVVPPAGLGGLPSGWRSIEVRWWDRPPTATTFDVCSIGCAAALAAALAMVGWPE